MNETQKAPKLTKKQEKNWQRICDMSLRIIFIMQIMFFAGTYVGGMWERNHTNEINSVKEAAIQSVKPEAQK